MLDWQPLILTLELALTTTLVLLIVAVPLAYWLAYTRIKLKPVIEAIVTLPLVLPPTVLGFYLLLAFGANSALGQFLQSQFGIQLAFSFEGLVLASVIYSLPFMVQPVKTGMESLSPSLLEASAVLGKSRLQTLFHVILPNIRKAIVTGIVMAFAHTIGEFGVVLMIGGNIPGKTRVASVAIYDQVEGLNYDSANAYALVLLGITFTILLVTYLLNGKPITVFRR